VSKSDSDRASWGVQTLRLTGLLEPGTRLSSSGWWRAVAGEEPEVQNSQPKLGQLQEQGPYAGGVLTLALMIGRFDWILSSRNETETLGPFPELGERFVRILAPWLASAGPAVHRLALGAGLLMSVADARQAAVVLSGFLPSVNADPEETTDLLFQINRPIPLRVEGVELKINRVSKWSSAEVRTAQVMVGPGIQDLSTTDSRTFCRLDLDINTSQERTEALPDELLSPLLSRFLEIGLEISKEGDKP